MKQRNPQTRLVHAGRDPGRQHGLVNPPACHGSTSVRVRHCCVPLSHNKGH